MKDTIEEIEFVELSDGGKAYAVGWYGKRYALFEYRDFVCDNDLVQLWLNPPIFS